jgi:hypothetical protein
MFKITIECNILLLNFDLIKILEATLFLKRLNEDMISYP